MSLLATSLKIGGEAIDDSIRKTADVMLQVLYIRNLCFIQDVDLDVQSSIMYIWTLSHHGNAVDVKAITVILSWFLTHLNNGADVESFSIPTIAESLRTHSSRLPHLLCTSHLT